MNPLLPGEIPESSRGGLHGAVDLPPVSPEVKKALNDTGRLPAATADYRVSDILALAISSDASDLHLRVGEPPLYRIDGRLIRAEGAPLDAKRTYSLIEAFAPEELIRKVRDVGQADFGFVFE